MTPMRYLVLFLVVLLVGCGTTTERQSRSVKTEKYVVPALVFDTPAGQVRSEPAVFYRQSEESTESTDKKTIDVPDVAPVVTALAGGTPWGAIISGVVGLGTAAFAAKKALTNGRQRDEVIDGVERSKDKLPPGAWEILSTHLEAEQNADTKAIVQARTT